MKKTQGKKLFISTEIVRNLSILEGVSGGAPGSESKNSYCESDRCGPRTFRIAQTCASTTYPYTKYTQEPK